MTGFHLLAADASSGYAWRTVATLAEPGIETDRWIGNACLTQSGRRAIVVYAPRSFANKAVLARRGGFTAIVDMRSGAVTKLPLTTSLAYFNPGCGHGESAVLTQEGDEDLGATRLTSVDASTGELGAAVKMPGQVTSAVSTTNGIVAADGNYVVQVGRSGRVKPLARMTNTPFDLHADSGGVTYLDRLNNTVRVERTAGTKTRTLADGVLGKVALSSGTAGHVYVTGTISNMAAMPSTVQYLKVPADAEVSTEGVIAIRHVNARKPTVMSDPARRSTDLPDKVLLQAQITGTGKSVSFTIDPRARTAKDYLQGQKPVMPFSAGKRAAGIRPYASTTGPIDDDRWCSIPRNDIHEMAYQPTARQVEWATDLAVTGDLNTARPANYRGWGLPSYSPQGLFPKPTLQGPANAHVPPQIFLGIMSQESNLWQADRYAEPGENSNPLTGNFYGLKTDDKTGAITDWTIHWENADCGYGISQMTDGMRIAGHLKPGEPVLTGTQQATIALDYAANISAGLKLVSDKWNELYSVMRPNNGDPSRIENWYFAAWDYNSGFYPASDASSNHGAYGLGWFNNPANPRYPAGRAPFLYNNSWSDAAHPQDWNYPEKVIGFASWSIDTVDGPGFRPAWWNSDIDRYNATPQVNQFCDASNDCEPGQKIQPTDPSVSDQPAGPCAHQYNGYYDLHCYYHQSNTWKSDCDTSCGYELMRFDKTYPEQPDGTHFPAQCIEYKGLPNNAYVIDDVPNGTIPAGCPTSTGSAGNFSFNFDPYNKAPATLSSKIDMHQLGGGLDGHFWFAHTHSDCATCDDPNHTLSVTGTWTFNSSVNGWARVMVHVPDHGAHTREATYHINDTLNSFRVVQQRTQANQWVSLGVFKFAGTPRVSLSNQTRDGNGNEDIAWDAIAVQPLSAKPKNVVVALGDSYSSGEGVSAKSNPSDYYKETDVDGSDPAWRDACHRSPNAWSRQAILSDSSNSIGYRADNWDNGLDYHMLACSGAQTNNLLGQNDPPNAVGTNGQSEYGELPQFDEGYLDVNTTLVTLSIGGNDAGFAPVMENCVEAALIDDRDCSTDTLNGQPLSQTVPASITTAASSIVTVLNEISLKAPNAKIVLMGYPHLLSPTAPSGSGTQCNVSSLSQTWINKMSDLLDTKMSGAVQSAINDGTPATFADPRSAFEGKGACGSPESIHAIVLDLTLGDDPKFQWHGFKVGPSQQSFHPEIAGATLYANVLNQTLRSMGM